MKQLFALFCFAMAIPMFLSAQGPVFSEGFESGQISPKVWDQRLQGDATISVEQDQVMHGKYALRVHYPEAAARSYAFIVATHLPESVEKHFFGRTYARIDPSTPFRHTVLLFAGGPAWPLSKFEEIGVYQGMFQPSYQENKSPRGQGRGEDVRHGEATPFGKWFLLEWEFNDDPSTLTIWVDGQKSLINEGDKKVDFASFKWPKGTDTNKDLVGEFEEFGFGARVWGDVPQAFDVYYDDIAIGTSRIGPAR